MEKFWSNLKNKNKIIPKEFNIFADQTVTNLTFTNKIKFLDPKYNVYTTTLEETQQKDPAIIHFTGPHKPLTYRNSITAIYDEIYYDYYDESRNLLGDNGGKFLKNTLKRLSQELISATNELQNKDRDVRSVLDSAKRDVKKYRSEAEMWRHESARLNGELLELKRVVPLVKQLFKSLDAAIRRRIERLNVRKARRIKVFTPSTDTSRSSLLLSVKKYDLDTYYIRSIQSDRLIYKVVMASYNACYKFTIMMLIATYKLIRKARK
jgi:lipopolysaccharide biosynthesis glycosyltransferase